ncbi:MAG TPA: pyridine nucleotide-disulfide oxidoreductase, partial [Archaeoglobus profundus]|nr:pyridine nucleotide-disulfide oxidoreductase [Archaeoglobus profundus]
MNIVVIGGGACGLKAACRARRRDPDAEITVIEASKYPSLGRCGLPYYVGGIVNSIDDLRKTLAGAVRDADYFKSIKNIDVLIETKAEKIDRNRKVVHIVKKDGSTDEIPYDYLVISTGARPVRLNLPNADAEGVVTLFDPDDAETILNLWEEEALDKAVIIGGGLIGLEMAEAFSRLDVDVTIVEIKDHILPALLDREMAMLVQSYLVEKGIKVLTGSRVTEIIARDGKVAGVKVDGKEIEAQLVLMAVGVRPNVELAKDAGLTIGETGAIKVNERLQTSDPNIYAGGDCVENIHLITGKPIYMPLGTIANKHGRVIGDNITGGNSTFPGVLGTTIFKVLDLNVARTGLSEKQAKELGYEVITALVPGPDRSHYYPGQKPIRIKLIADAKSGRILGAQIVGFGVVDKRIDVVATAIQMKATIYDLANLDLAYAPPYSTALDTLIHAANVVKNKKDGLYQTISSYEVKSKLERGEDIVILDVRTEEEYRKFKKIESEKVIRIPLKELRKSIDKLPKDKEIIIVCQIGNRAYEAQRILQGYGFKNVKVMEGGMA